MLLQNDQAIGVLQDCGLQELCSASRLSLFSSVAQDVGVDLIALVKDPNIIFDGDPYIHFQDFLNEMLLLRGSNNATVKDLTVLKNQLLQTLPPVLKRKLRL